MNSPESSSGKCGTCEKVVENSVACSLAAPGSEILSLLTTVGVAPSSGEASSPLALKRPKFIPAFLFNPSGLSTATNDFVAIAFVVVVVVILKNVEVAVLVTILVLGNHLLLAFVDVIKVVPVSVSVLVL